LDADLAVVAEVGHHQGHPDPGIQVVSVPWPGDKADRKLTKITIDNLADMAKENGWQGPGRYILPLRRQSAAGVMHYQIARIPDSPGFPPRSAANAPIRYRIYADTPDTRAQLQNMRESKWEE
jgi:hypothetical protein